MPSTTWDRKLYRDCTGRSRQGKKQSGLQQNRSACQWTQFRAQQLAPQRRPPSPSLISSTGSGAMPSAAAAHCSYKAFRKMLVPADRWGLMLRQGCRRPPGVTGRGPTASIGLPGLSGGCWSASLWAAAGKWGQGWWVRCDRSSSASGLDESAIQQQICCGSAPFGAGAVHVSDGAQWPLSCCDGHQWL